jgi:hypothetical protein
LSAFAESRDTGQTGQVPDESVIGSPLTRQVDGTDPEATVDPKVAKLAAMQTLHGLVGMVLPH